MVPGVWCRLTLGALPPSRGTGRNDREVGGRSAGRVVLHVPYRHFPPLAVNGWKHAARS
jgi:hypothetical protein